MRLWNLNFKELRKHPGRAVLTLLSIAIGVAAVVAVSVATSTIRQAYGTAYEAVGGRAALAVSSVLDSGIEQRWLDEFRRVAGVKHAVGAINRPTTVYVSGRRVRATALGVDVESFYEVQDYKLTSGTLFEEEQTVLLDGSFAKSLGLVVGDEFRFNCTSGRQRFTVGGVVEPRDVAALRLGSSMFLPLPTAQRLFKAARPQYDDNDALVGYEPTVDVIHLVLEPDADEDRVEAQVHDLLPAWLRVHASAGRSNQLAQETILAVELGLDMARAFAGLSAVFIIANTLLMSVSERRRNLATLRAIGATRRQVAWLVYREAIALGLAGTVLGATLGVLGAQGLIAMVARIFETRLPPPQLSWEPFALGAAVGLGMSLLGAYVPARRAGKLSPVEGMRGLLLADIEAGSIKVVVVGASLATVALGVLVASLFGLLPVEVTVVAGLCVLVGLVLVLPAFVVPSSSVARLLLRPWRAEARLAQMQILRHRTRTTLTIGVLFIAVSTGIGLANSVLDNVNDVRRWYRSTIVGDFFVRVMMPDMQTGRAPQIPEAVDAQIRSLGGVESIGTVRLVSVEIEDNPVIVLAREFPQSRELAFDLVDGNMNGLRARLENGEAVIGSVLANRAQVTAGDTLPVPTETGLVQLPVAAVMNDYLAGGLTIHMHRKTAKQLLDVEGVDAYAIVAQRGHEDALKPQLEQLVDEHGLMLQSFTDISRMIEGLMVGIVASLWALLALSLIVASFGVVNTLTMNVLEQTRELGLLRIIAMTRGQVRRVVLGQAAMIGLIALVPGLLAGLVVAWFLHRATHPVTGHAVGFGWHPWLFIGAAVGGMFIVLAAAWLPAQRAARLELADALSYE